MSRSHRSGEELESSAVAGVRNLTASLYICVENFAGNIYDTKNLQFVSAVFVASVCLLRSRPTGASQEDPPGV
jgi:hypothetical protein